MILGDLASSTQTPLIALHGGPGAGHEYMLVLAELYKRSGIPVLLYDQVGCGRSTRLRKADPSIFTIDFFLDELNNLLTALKIKSYDLLGHSWGGVLGLEHAVRNPPGLRKLVLEGCPASMELVYNVKVQRCFSQLPAELLGAIYQHEEDDKDTEDYKAAMNMYLHNNMCRVDPFPDSFLASLQNFRDDPTVLEAIIGKSNIAATGAMRNWSIIDRIPLIKTDILVTHGGHDYCGREAVEPLLHGLPNGRGVLFEKSSHMPHLEAKERFLDCVTEFLTC